MKGSQKESLRMKDIFRFENMQLDLLGMLANIDEKIASFLRRNIQNILSDEGDFYADEFRKNVKIKPQVKGQALNVTILHQPGNIIFLSGQYSSKVASPSYEPYNKVGVLPFLIALPNGVKPVQISDSHGSPVVIFPKIADIPGGAHTYDQITKALAIIVSHSTDHGIGSDDKLAQCLLLRLRGTDYPVNINADYKEYLDCLLVLMFGIETSQHNFTLLSSLMLLDLIAAKARYGNGKVFNWKCAFISSHGYIQSDLDDNGYAGKFPMAVKRSGPGSTGNGVYPGLFDEVSGKKVTYDNCSQMAPHLVYGRASLLIMVNQGKRDDVVEILDRYPQRHGILKRELSLLGHWLRHLFEVGYYETEAINSLEKSYPNVTLRTYITQTLVLSRINHMLTGCVISYQNPKLAVGSFLLPYDDKKLNYVNSISKQKLPVIPPRSDTHRFVVRHQDEALARKSQSAVSKSMHYDKNCKLIPGYARNNHFTLYAKGEKHIVLGARVQEVKQEMYIKDSKPCSRCEPK